jgi:hypothetical protein
MQKLSSYLYPNRVLVHASLGESPMEWRIVYQRNVKVYQGLDNTIEFDFKNAQQRRIDISALTLRCVILDQEGRQLTILPVNASSIKGIGTLTIPKIVGDILKPQFLSYSVYSESSGVKTPVYADTQFGMQGKMELIGGVFPHLVSTFDFTEFSHNVTDDSYFHDTAIQVSNLNTVDLEFDLGELDGVISVLTATDTTISPSTVWSEIDQVTVTPTTSSLSKHISGSLPSAKWLRIVYQRTGLTLGKIDRVIARLYYTI